MRAIRRAPATFAAIYPYSTTAGKGMTARVRVFRELTVRVRLVRQRIILSGLTFRGLDLQSVRMGGNLCVATRMALNIYCN